MVTKAYCIVCAGNFAVRRRERMHVERVMSVGDPRSGEHESSSWRTPSNALGRRNEVPDSTFRQSLSMA
jgi:hypothetical protein